MAWSRDRLPSGDNGGFLSVPGVVRSPVVKKSTAACLGRSLESNTRPSLVAVTAKPYFLPSEVIVCSTMLGLPSMVFTTSCSKPDDFVNTSTDFFSAPKKSVGKAILAPAMAAAFMNRRRLKPRLRKVFIDVLSFCELEAIVVQSAEPSIGFRTSLSLAQPEHSAIRFPVGAGLGKIIKRALRRCDDVTGYKGRALFCPLLAIFQAAFPFEDRPSGKVILCQLGEDRGKIDLAVAQRTEAPGARNPGLISAIDSLAATWPELRILHVKHPDSGMIDVDEFQVIELLQHKMAWIKEDIAAGVASQPIQKHFKGYAVVKVLAGVDFKAKINASGIENIQHRSPAFCQFLEGRLDQTRRALRPGIKIGPGQCS